MTRTNESAEGSILMGEPPFAPTPLDAVHGVRQLQDRCADILDRRYPRADFGYTAARRNLLKLSEGRSRLNVLSTRRFNSFSSAVITLGGSHLHLTRFESTTECETISTRGAGDRYVFHIPLKGALELSVDQLQLRVAPGEMAIVTHAGQIAKAWSGSKDTLNYVIERGFLEAVVASEFGGDRVRPIHFPEIVSLNDEPAILDLIRHVIEDYARANGLGASPILSRQLGVLLVSAILARLPHSRQKEFRDGRRPASAPGFVRRFERYVESNLSAPFDLDALAAHAGVSVRTLYSGLKQFRDESPLAFIINRRLDRAREILIAANAEKPRIDHLARSLGFRSTSHFSRKYRERFGEAPIQTINTETRCC